MLSKNTKFEIVPLNWHFSPKKGFLQTHMPPSGVTIRTARTGQRLTASQLQEKIKIPRNIARNARIKNSHVSIAWQLN